MYEPCEHKLSAVPTLLHYTTVGRHYPRPLTYVVLTVGVRPLNCRPMLMEFDILSVESLAAMS